MRLLSLISRNAFVKEDVQSQNPHAAPPTDDGYSPEKQVTEVSYNPDYDAVWKEVAINHNPLDAAIKSVLGPIDEDQFHDVVAHMKYHLEQTEMAILQRDVSKHSKEAVRRAGSEYTGAGKHFPSR